VDPVTVSIVIDRPRVEVFEYLADLANHSEFTDHYLVDWRMTSERTYGRGAGARFQLKQRGNRFNWADVTFAEVEPHHRIVEVGRAGKFNRIRSMGIYELTEGAGGTTKVSFTLATKPKLLSDRIMESLGARRFHRRGSARALRRLRSILERGEGRGQRVTIAGGVNPVNQ
jgi:uncharacterized protein YndB with AHSA1/START domain